MPWSILRALGHCDARWVLGFLQEGIQNLSRTEEVKMEKQVLLSRQDTQEKPLLRQRGGLPSGEKEEAPAISGH